MIRLLAVLVDISCYVNIIHKLWKEWSTQVNTHNTDKQDHKNEVNTVEPRYKEVLGTIKITLLYQVSHYFRVKNKEI